MVDALQPRRLLTRCLAAIATHGPVAWAADWHDRVVIASLREAFEGRLLGLADVLPWPVQRPDDDSCESSPMRHAGHRTLAGDSEISMDKVFLFDLGARVAIVASGETGVVIGRAQYVNSCNDYRVRYTEAGSGKAVEHWWNEDALKAA
jgi:hypothetical protein